MNKKIKKFTIPILAIAVFAVVAFMVSATPENSNETSNSAVATSRGMVTLYKSPTCGCCVKYTAYLEKKGFDVEVIATNDIQAVKDEHNIPHNMASCHTVVIDDYFVEGHVPIEVIDKLLAEAPLIDGISLPGMPSGSPGMPGFKRGPFEVFALTEGVAENYINY